MTPDADELGQSVAYAALSKLARRAHEFIIAEAARSGVSPTAIGWQRFVEAGFSSGQRSSAAVRELVALGIVDRGKSGRGVALFSASERWRAVTNAAQAAAIAAEARRPVAARPRREGANSERKPHRTVQPEQPPPVEQPPPSPRITLPTIDWPSATGRRILGLAE